MKGRITYRRRLDACGNFVEEPIYLLDGKEVTHDEFWAAYQAGLPGIPGEGPMVPSSKGWPMASEAMSVHPKQIDLAKKLDRQRGAPPTEYNQKGQPIWTSEDHKRKFNRAHGVHDNNSYNC